MCRIDIIRGAPGIHPVCFYTERRRQPWKRGILNKRPSIYITLLHPSLHSSRGIEINAANLANHFIVADVLRMQCGCGSAGTLCRGHSEIDVENPAASLMRPLFQIIEIIETRYFPSLSPLFQNQKSSTVTYRCCRSTQKPDIRISTADSPTSKTQSTTSAA